MAISKATREEIFERDDGKCQLWHTEPTPGSELSHFSHQGIGGLPDTHPKNQAANLITACHECHARFHQGRRYTWEAFTAARLAVFGVDMKCHNDLPQRCTDPGIMQIRAPNGNLVPQSDLWFYVRWDWKQAEAKSEALKNMIQQERLAAWKVAEYLAWFKSKGVAPAVGSADYLDLGASLGLSSADVKRRIRMCVYRMTKLSADADSAMAALDIEVADRLRKIPETDLVEVAGWFAELPPAEAWARFNDKYPGPERQKKYRIFTGSYREVTAATDDAVEIQGGAVVVKGGSVIAGVRKEVADE